MAGASLNDIKARIRSVTGTMQITKAMELVATSKLRHAKVRAENASAYRAALEETIGVIAKTEAAQESVWFSGGAGASPKTLLIAVAGDRGLAGGFNAGIFRLAAEISGRAGEVTVLPIGKKAADHFAKRGYPLYTEEILPAAGCGVGKAMELSKRIAEDFENGKYSRVILIYTKFLSMMTQTPNAEVLLPFSGSEEKNPIPPTMDGNANEALSAMIPDLLGGILSAAVLESLASESAARRSAMNSANKNAAEMIDDLGLKYNRARQAVITQEITEIVSGAEAL